jgi:hypothetical protein
VNELPAIVLGPGRDKALTVLAALFPGMVRINGAAFEGEPALLGDQLWEFIDELDRRGELIARLSKGRSFDNALRIAIANTRAADTRRYRAQGYSIKQTALKMGTNPRQVSRWLARPTKD